MNKKFSSDRSFGILLFLFLIILHYIFFRFEYSIILPVAILILLISFIKPSFFKYPNIIWIKLGLVLGKFLNPVICTILYFFVIGLTKIILDVFRIKLIHKKKREKIKSYWIYREKGSFQSFNTQF